MHKEKVFNAAFMQKTADSANFSYEKGSSEPCIDGGAANFFSLSRQIYLMYSGTSGFPLAEDLTQASHTATVFAPSAAHTGVGRSFTIAL